MTKKKRSARSKPSPKKRSAPAPPRNAQGRFVGVRGMSPREVEAWRAQEVRERKKDAAARDELLRSSGKKPGRPRGPKRLQREAESAQRRDELRRQQRERKGRARRSTGAKYKLPPKGKRGVVEKRRTKREGVEKTVVRAVGGKAFEAAEKALRELPRGYSAWVQVGTGYGPKGRWVGSRLTSPADASHWLQGIGQQYRSKIFPSYTVNRLWVEVVAYRKAK